MEEEKKKKQPRQPLTPALDLFERACKEWWKNLGGFVAIYIQMLYQALIPLVVILIFGLIAGWKGEDLNVVARLSISMVFICAFLYLVYLMIQAMAAIILYVKRDYKGEARDLFKEGRKYIWSYLWIEVLMALWLCLWFLLLIIPGIIFSIYYCFSEFAFFIEDKKGQAAIKRSRNLVRGYWWPIFWRVFVVGIIFWAFSLIISLPIVFMDENGLAANCWNFLVQIVSFLIGPISVIFMYKLFLEIRKIKDGLSVPAVDTSAVKAEAEDLKEPAVAEKDGE